MPQVSDKFGPIYQSVVLDASGNGQVQFQAQGANVRITNLFVRVSTTTNQAVATIYKGYIADGNQLSNTNSGSTGAAAHGAIDLFDGETCIVRWTGGDVGATATASFVGVKLNFNEAPTSSQLSWDDPIAAGDGSLVYPALKSPNFVAGISGWQISRNGDAEFNDAIIRGELVVIGTSNGSIIITNEEISVGDFEPTISLLPPEVAGFTGYNANRAAAKIQALEADSGTQASAQTELSLQAPTPQVSLDVPRPEIVLTSGRYDDTGSGEVLVWNPADSSRLDIRLLGNVTIAGNSTEVLNLLRVTTNAIGAAFRAMVSGDSNARIEISSTGQINWGTGAAGADTNLYRSGVSQLRTDDSFIVNTNKTLNNAAVKINDDPQTTNSAAIGGTETVIHTLTQTLQLGDEYDIRVCTAIALTAATATDNYIVKIRENSVAGTILMQGQIMPQTTSSIGYTITMNKPYVAVATGSKTFVVTLIRNSGTAANTGFRAAASDRPSTAEVWRL